MPFNNHVPLQGGVCVEDEILKLHRNSEFFTALDPSVNDMTVLQSNVWIPSVDSDGFSCGYLIKCIGLI